MAYVSSIPFTAPAAPMYYSASTPVSYSPLKSTPVPISPALPSDLRGTANLITEVEGQAAEGTPLSAALCARLGVPAGTLWGPPSGQVSKQAGASASPNKSQPPSPTLQASKPGTQV